MPRNPDKTRCAVPGCHNWAMRGHTRCRAHRDAELGPRGTGAPPGNLNALRHGTYAHPLPPPDLERLADAILERPADLPLQLGLAVQSIQSRAGDPLRALIALRALLTRLTERVTARIWSAQLCAALRALPRPARDRLLDTLEHHTRRSPQTTPPPPPGNEPSKKKRRKQLPEPGSE